MVLILNLVLNLWTDLFSPFFVLAQKLASQSTRINANFTILVVFFVLVWHNVNVSKKEREILMKKGLFGMVMLLSLMLVLSACGTSRVEPKEAGEITVNSIVYNKDTDKIKDVYGEDGSDFEKEFEKSFKESFITTFTASFSSDVNIDKEVDTFYNALRKQVNEKTSYTTKVTNDDKESPEIQFAVKGLNMKGVQTELTEELTKAVTADPSIAMDDEKMAKKTMEIYTKAVQNADAVSESKNITLKLTVNSKDDSLWKMENDMAFMQELTTAFFLGGMQ